MNGSVLFILAWAGANEPIASTPPNDECVNAIPISGAGIFSFDSTEATASPQPPVFCNYKSDSGFEADVWFIWTPERMGYTEVSTCGATTVDTKIAIHDLDCATLDAVLECNDDGCLYQSMVTFYAVLGQPYFIRIGSPPGLGGGEGSFRIGRGEPYPVPPDPSDFGCPSPADPSPYETLETCNARDRWDAHNSTRGQFTVSDEFVPDVDGNTTGVCWWGTYLQNGEECERGLVDFFEITYYADDCGAPGEIIAGPFSQEDVTMEVIGPIETYESFPNGAFEYQYSARHDPVMLLGGQVYWISISNSYYNNCSWFWENALGPGGHAIQIDAVAQSMAVIPTDIAFCSYIVENNAPLCSLPPPVNDDCADALPLAFDEVFFDTIGATTDGPINVPVHEPLPNTCDFPLGDEQVHKDVWYNLEAPCWGTLRIDLCDSSFDTKLSVYEGAVCPPAEQAVACNDDACGADLGWQSQVNAPVAEGKSYKIRVGGYAGAWGKGSLHMEYTPPTRTMLWDFAVFTRCFTGSCDPPCNHPQTPDPCCLGQDFDADGDIDLDDYRAFHVALTGP